MIGRTFEVEGAFHDSIIFTIRSIQLDTHPNSGSEFHSAAVSVLTTISETVDQNVKRLCSLNLKSLTHNQENKFD